MTTTYDPSDPRYLDAADLREELTRVFDLCHGCRLCFKYCSAFPTLFELIDRDPHQDAASLTPAEQDRVVDECFNCKLCYVNCPYVPGQHEWALDFPRLMMRAEQVLAKTRGKPVLERVTDVALTNTDMVGRVNSALAPVVNRSIGRPGSLSRKLMEKVVGISSVRVLPPYARERFSTWFRKRTARLGRAKRAEAILFPTCMVEYQEVGIGRDMVKVYERNGIACSLPEGQVCCGAPALHSGDIDGFRATAARNVEVLADAIRQAQARGEDPTVAVPQPTCSYILKLDYPDYVPGPDADLVAAHTKDACELLWDVHKDGGGLDTDFAGDVPATTTYHAPCHLRAQNIGYRSRDVLKLTGTDVTVVAECSGIDGTWGLRAANVAAARDTARKMAAAIDEAGSDAVAGDCSLANGGIVLETGRHPVHPLQQLARAYALPDS